MTTLRRMLQAAGAAALTVLGTAAIADSDTRVLVKLPTPMQEHMLSNMRDHLQTLDQINRALAEQRWQDAADVAEQRLGISSLSSHGAEHMAPRGQ
jgi:hypothetical protein